jgi:uncharacterized membrane protein YdjX (TVP38/TMEM64 family)
MRPFASPLMNEPTAITEHPPPETPREGGLSNDAEPSKRSPFGIARIARIAALGIVVALLIYFYYRGDLTQENLKRIAAALPTSLFLPAFLVLPLCGVPINIFLLASGMKYGFAISIAIAAVGMGMQTLAAWHLAHSLFREKLTEWLSETRFELPTIPEQHQIWVTTVFVTIPGIPYAVKLYSLALTNLPFRRYFLIVWLVHVINAIPFIGIGIAAINVNVLWLIALGVLGLLTIVATSWLKNWYARSLEDPEKPGSDRATGT